MPVAKQTRRMILNTFESLLEEKNFDKITVVEIVERCGINRNTFYYYFQDIYELLEAWFEQVREKRKLVNQENMNLRDVFLRAKNFVQDHREIVYHIYKSLCHISLRKHLEKETYQQISAYIERQAEGLDINPEDKQALAIFYTAAIGGILLRWLNDEMKYDPEPYIERICRIMDGSIEQMLHTMVIENEKLTCVSL